MWAVFTLIWVMLDIWKSVSKPKKEIDKMPLGNELDLLKREKIRHFLPNQVDLYVYSVSELPYPNLPRRGQNTDNSMNGRSNDYNETPPRHPEYGEEINRIETHQNPTPQALSSAGFFFEADALKRENEMLKRKVMCVECRRHIDAVLIPCGHLIMCFNCAKECITCPICMEATTKIQKIRW